ncbi:Putative glycoside hydrolase, family 3, glycoside hydrolase family 3 domain, immunoglobulin [Colletotrichum destructivum]|uniref:beta-glucosidase n=1 Tax=Colletotrichum destructivum TaxID=34406 RepID=A0AAX4IKW7_9PEZI|nr:Putative glycoside hydrolase, family 3, glycoside hydrolase family 3 domain, immunoglobulin [Colletotrichum destructivum]
MAENTDIDAILKSLALGEKVRLLAGRNFVETGDVPEKGVPAIKTTDGPNGTRGAAIDGSTKAACFPAACSIAATFDREIARSVGRALAQESKAKGARCLLAPTVCIHRHPLGGRNFESYSEDPFLAGKLASEMIQGCQSLGVSATIKHFVANEQETARTTIDETISERALREIYLKPFEIAVKEARPWAIMSAYNLVNGKHCDSNAWLLKEVLRGEWGWDGLVMSDWGGTNSVAEGINAGMDIEMPGPPRIRKPAAVLDAVKNGEVTEAAIDERVRTILEWTEKLNGFRDPTITVEKAIDRPEHRALIRDAGARGIVLLKNDNGILPLTKEKVKGKTIALIGYAKDGLAHGGGSASVNAHYRLSPWDALHSAFGDDDDVTFTYAKGAHKERLLPPITKEATGSNTVGAIVGLDGQPGFSRVFHDFHNPGADPVSVLHEYPNSAYSPLGSQESMWKTLDIVGDFTPSETGTHYIACSGIGPTQVWVDDDVVFEQKGNCADPMGALFLAANEPEIKHAFVAGRTYRLRVHSEPPARIGLEILEGRTGVRMGFALESDRDADLQGEAARVASEADVAIVFTGHDPQWETEGRDQESFHLPCDQDGLIGVVAAANRNTVVVNSTGVAVAMPWLGDVAALAQSWFPGQECGNAIADVLTGAVCPEGKLPVSFPTRVEDAPAHGNFPGERDAGGRLRVEYAEGVFVGYRHYDRVGKEVLNFPFGYGLSYTTFDYAGFRVTRKADVADEFEVSVDVSNTGAVAGGAVVQVYAGKTERSADTPVKVLVAFDKVRLQAGETQTVKLSVTAKDFASFDETERQWVVEAGEYSFYLGDSAAEVLQTAAVTLDRITYRR